MIGKLILTLLVSFVLIELAVSNPIPFKDCGSTAKAITVDVSDCPKFPCILKKGNNYTINFNFSPSSDSAKVYNKVYGVIAGVPVPFPIPQEDACGLGLLQCPVKNGNTYSESITLSVLPVYPSLSLYVKFELVDDNGKTMICSLFPAAIQG